MTELVAALADGTARVVGWTLLHGLWQGAAAALAAAVLLRLRPASRPGLRYAAAAGALAAFAIGVALTGVELGRDWSEHAWCWERVEAYGTLEASAARACAGHGVFIKDAPAAASQLSPVHLGAMAVSRMAGWIGLLWVLGVAFQAIRLAGELRLVRRLRRGARPLTGERVESALARAWSRVGPRRRPEVARHRAVDSPCVVGGLRPLVLLPSWVDRLEPAEFEMLLAHELAHVRRYDYAANLLQRVIEAAFFFHPSVRWLSARVREEREACCDRRAVGGSVASLRSYVVALSSAERLRAGRRSLAAGVGLGHGGLAGRMRRLVEANRGRPSRGVTLASRIATAVFVTAVAVGWWSSAAEYGVTHSSFAVMTLDLRDREPIPHPDASPVGTTTAAATTIAGPTNAPRAAPASTATSPPADPTRRP